jgi:membrane dipeptidase
MEQASPSLTPAEARQLHYDALVIDAQQPPVTGGFLFTDRMKDALATFVRRGMTRYEIAPLMEELTGQEIVTSESARKTYLQFWDESGVTVACGTYSASEAPSKALDRAENGIAQVYGMVDALDGNLILVRQAGDIERAHQEGKHGVILDFQNTTPFGDDLDRIGRFRALGVRMVQLTYNLRNLVGEGCTETYQGGLSHFGHEVVRRLNHEKILVDVSHCSEQTGWDALKISKAPIIVSHSSSKTVCHHVRGKSDELAKAIADRGGFFGVVVVPGFISESKEVTLDDFARHIEHLVDVCGIDHVGIGTDKAGPGPGTDSMVEYPSGLSDRRPEGFDWVGWIRKDERRLTPDFHLNGYENFSDWPNLTVHLAKRGFNEVELRKLIGLNFLRVFRDVCG